MISDDTRIDQLDLTARAFHCLRNFGCKTYADVKEIDLAAFARMDNVGRKTYNELLEFLPLECRKPLSGRKHNQKLRELKPAGATLYMTCEQIDEVAGMLPLDHALQEPLAKAKQRGEIDYNFRLKYRTTSPNP